ncbi:ferritin [uncultured Desulfovibrio sp.]|uniref:ferritin n=1 Tax=uncultured Desulfovibrio sp. TaxID=167968 RepID=UPI0025D1D8FD|nr:ferritin [uncultured Desulfovibrio sp.]
MNEKVAALLKDQVNKEFYSAYLYLAFSNYYYGVSLDGFGHWFEVQAREEQEHAMKILKYLQDNNEKVTLEAIAAPNVDFSDHKAPLTAALKHEQYVTSLINAIYREARQCDDFRTCQFLDWFIAEQGEEEKNTSDLIAKFELFGSDTKGLYLLNAELNGRADTSATAEA